MGIIITMNVMIKFLLCFSLVILRASHDPTKDPYLFKKLISDRAFSDVSVQARVIKVDGLLGALGSL